MSDDDFKYCKFGAVVRYDLDGYREPGVIIGTLTYNRRVVMFANEQAIGMPIHYQYLTHYHVDGEPEMNLESAITFRARYNKLYPDAMESL